MTTLQRISRFKITLPYPDLDFLSQPPLGWTKNPGRKGFPNWQEYPVLEGVPVISFKTDEVFTDETIAIMGHGLNNAEFVFWIDGVLLPSQAIRTENDRAQILVPQYSLTSNNGQRIINDSVTMLWALNNVGYSLPILLNVPEIYWISPETKWTEEDNRTIRIFGKNLHIQGKSGYAIGRVNGGPALRYRITSAKPSELIITLPVGYAAGNYEFQVHNGTGSNFGWSNAKSITVADNPYLTALETEIHLSSYAGNSFLEKLNNAKEAARPNGATILFSGTHIMTSSFDGIYYAPTYLPANATGEPPIRLKGNGSGTTSIITSGNYESIIYLTSAGSELEGFYSSGVRWNVRNKDITFKNVDMDGNNSVIENYLDKVTEGHPSGGGWKNGNLRIYNSNLNAVNTSIAIGGIANVHISGNNIRARFHSGFYDHNGVLQPAANSNVDNHGISIRGTNNVLIEHNTFRSQNASGGHIMTRAIAILHSSDYNHVIQNNDMRWIGAFQTCPASGLDQNTGEIILYHGIDTGTFTTIREATSESITVDIQAARFRSAIDYKVPVRVATTAAGTFGSSFASGQVIDGVTVSTGDRILIKNQSTTTQNGVYAVNTTGSPTRVTDYDSSNEIVNTLISVSAGTTNGGSIWHNTNTGSVTVDTTPITWEKIDGGFMHVYVYPETPVDIKSITAIITSGKAIGQAKIINSVEDLGSGVTKINVPKMNAIPASGDTIALRPAFWHNIVTDNVINAVPDPENYGGSAVQFSRVGVMFYVAPIECTVSNNTISNTLIGTVMWSSARGQETNVSIGNNVRGNRYYNMMKSGSLPYYQGNYPKAYSSSVGGQYYQMQNRMHGVGNAFRGNICSGSVMGVQVGGSDHDLEYYPRNDSDYPLSSTNGMIHDIIEGNEFYEITGISGTIPGMNYSAVVVPQDVYHPDFTYGISTGANWTLIRNNIDNSTNIDFHREDKTYEVLQY